MQSCDDSLGHRRRPRGRTKMPDRLGAILKTFALQRNGKDNNIEIDFVLMEEFLLECQRFRTESEEGSLDFTIFSESGMLVENAAHVYNRKVDLLIKEFRDLLQRITDNFSSVEEAEEPVVQSNDEPVLGPSGEPVAGPSGESGPGMRKKTKKPTEIIGNVGSLLTLKVGNNIQELSNGKEAEFLTNSDIEIKHLNLTSSNYILKDYSGENIGPLTDFNVNSITIPFIRHTCRESDDDEHTEDNSESHQPDSLAALSQTTIETMITNNGELSEIENSPIDTESPMDESDVILSTQSTLNEILNTKNDTEILLDNDLTYVIGIAEEITIHTTETTIQPYSSAVLTLPAIAPAPPMVVTNAAPRAKRTSEHLDDTTRAHEFLTFSYKHCKKLKMSNSIVDFELNEKLINSIVNKRKHKLVRFWGSQPSPGDIKLDDDKLYICDTFVPQVRTQYRKLEMKSALLMLFGYPEEDFRGFVGEIEEEDLSGFKGFTENQMRLLRLSTSLVESDEDRLPDNISDRLCNGILDESPNEPNNSNDNQNLMSIEDAARMKVVIEWHQYIRKRIEEIEKRPEPTIKEYIDNEFKLIKKNIANIHDIKKKANYETSLYFLATLMMATSENVEIIPKPNTLKDGFLIKLLTLDRRKLFTCESDFFKTNCR